MQASVSILCKCWASIIANQLIEPYILTPRLTGRIYWTFLNEVLPELWENIPLIMYREMCFQQNCDTAHFTIAVK